MQILNGLIFFNMNITLLWEANPVPEKKNLNNVTVGLDECYIPILKTKGN